MRAVAVLLVLDITWGNVHRTYTLVVAPRMTI